MKKRNVILAIIIAIALLAISTGTSVLAYDSDDDNTIEARVYWVCDYIFDLIYPDLNYPDDCAASFSTMLANEGWTTGTNEGDDDVTQSDLESDYGVETVDLGVFAGHGNIGSLILQNDFLGTDEASYGDCSWGDGDLEWMLLMACNCLEYDDDASGLKTNGQFANSLDGIRIICGSHTTYSMISTSGYEITERLTDYDTGGGTDDAQMVVDAWFGGSDIANVSGRVLRAIGETYGILDNDYIWGQETGPYSSSFTVDDYYYSFSYNCT
jgi:hypothetical protein